MARPTAGRASEMATFPWASDGVANDAQRDADLATEEEQGDDGDDGDESKDECVFREALTCFLASNPGEGAKDEVREHGA